MTISVIIPCFNAEPYVGQTVGSVLEQTRPADDIIVVDDGSTDGSVDVVRQFGDRVQLLTGRNGGGPASRNRGAAHATGDALMFLDADDVLGPTVLEALADTLTEHPGAVAACPWYRLEHEAGAWVRRPPSCTPRRVGQDALAAWLVGWYHPPCSVLWSREAYELVGPWEEGLASNQDGHLMMQALARGVHLVLTDQGEAFYRRLRTGDAPSVSSGRLTERGLSARLWVLEQVAQTLECEGRLRPYREVLDGALERVGREASDQYPEVTARAVALARQYAGYPWIRTVRRVLRKAAAAARPLLGRSRQPAQVKPSEEVHHGLGVDGRPDARTS